LVSDERLSPQQSLAKIQSALQLLDAITVILRDGVRHSTLVIPFLDVTVTFNLTLISVEQTAVPPSEETKH
jgi:hypothetical protein